MGKLIVAHRGASKFFRENTAEAFQKAVEVGADMIELDVRRTKDGRIVVHHNEVLGGWPIRWRTFESARKASQRRGYEMPLLEDVFRQFAGRIKFDVELKETGYEGEVVTLALKYMRPEDVVFTSFRAPSVVRIKECFPQVSAGLLRGTALASVLQGVYFADPGFIFDGWRQRSRAVAVSDFFVIQWLLFPMGLSGWYVQSGKKYFVYTVDDLKYIAKFWNDPELLGVITNTPDKARRVVT